MAKRRPVLAIETAQPNGELTTKYARLTTTEQARILLLRDEGLSVREIAEDIGCAHSSVHQTLERFKEKEDAIRLAIIGNVEQRIANWDKAEEVAVKRGDHRPTKERMEMAIPKLRPQPAIGAGNGGGVVINIGAPGAPIRLPDIQISPEPISVSPPVSLCKSTLTVDGNDDSVA